GERRRAAGDAARERALWPREGRVHWGGRAAVRQGRAGGRRDDLSRRDRRGAVVGAGEDPPCAGGARGPAGGGDAAEKGGRVRVVAATNQSLREAVDAGKFRADLFYRLSVLQVYLPPLRERPEDIALLVRRFIQEYSAQHDRPFHGVSAEAMQLLTDYAWPGN